MQVTVDASSPVAPGSGNSKARLASHRVVMSGDFDQLQEASGSSAAGQIHEAAMCGDMGLLEDCLNEGQDINTADKAGCTPLHLAAKQGNELTVHFLLENGADVRSKNKEGELALDAAEPETELAETLLDYMEWRTRMDRRYQCTVSLRDGTLVGASPSDRLECWFEPETCTVHFRKLHHTINGCFGFEWRRGGFFRRAFGGLGGAPRLPAASRLCGRGVTVPHTAGVEAVDALTVRLNFAEEDPLLPSGHEPLLVGRGAGGKGQPEDPGVVSVNLLMCLAGDTAAALERMQRLHYRDALQVRDALLLSREMEGARVPFLELELASKREELTRLAKGPGGAAAGPEAQLHARLLVAEADGLKQELDEVRLSVSSTQAHAAAVARRAISKLEARAKQLPASVDGGKGPPLSPASAAAASAAAAVTNSIPILELYAGLAERAAEDADEGPVHGGGRWPGDGEGEGEAAEDYAQWPSLRPLVIPSHKEAPEAAAAAVSGSNEATPISSKGGDSVNFMAMPPLPPCGLSPLGNNNSASMASGLSEKRLDGPQSHPKAASKPQKAKKRTLVQRIAISKSSAVKSEKPLAVIYPKSEATAAAAPAADKGKLVAMADVEVVCTDGSAKPAAVAVGGDDAVSENKENRTAVGGSHPAAGSLVLSPRADAENADMAVLKKSLTPRKLGSLRRSKNGRLGPPGASGVLECPAPLFCLTNEQAELEPPMQASTSPLAMSSFGPRNPSGRHSRQLSRLRLSGSIDLSASMDLDGVLLSTMSFEKTPTAKRLTRQRPDVVPALDLDAIVPSPISPEPPAASALPPPAIKVAPAVSKSLFPPATGNNYLQAEKPLTLFELASAANSFPESPPTGLEAGVGADVDLSPEPGSDNGDFAAVRTSVSHFPVFPALHSSGPSSPQQHHALAAAPVATKEEEEDNVFSGLMNFMPSIFGCAEPQTTPPVPPLPLPPSGGFDGGDVPQLSGSESPRVPSFGQRLANAPLAKLPGAANNHELGGLSSPRDESPIGSIAHVGSTSSAAPSPSMTLAERKALINERLLQARVKASRLKTASPKPLRSSASLKPRVLRRTSIPGPGGSVSRSHNSKVAEVSKSINLRMSQEGLHPPAPAPDFSKVRSSLELRKSGTASCSITRASLNGPLKRGASPPPRSPERPKKVSIVSYPSRHISGPSAASYKTHTRLSSASSHPGMVTVNATPPDKKARAKTKTPPSRGPNSGAKRPAGGSRAGSPAVTPFKATAAAVAAAAGATLGGSSSTYGRGSPASGGASRLRPPTGHHPDSSKLRQPSYLKGTASSVSHNHPAATTTTTGTPSPEVSKSRVAAAARRWNF